VKLWYDERYASMGSEAMRSPEAYPIFLEGLPICSGARLLDVSCGSGHLLRAAAERGMETCGIDISEEAVRIARQVSPDSDVRVADCAQLPFESGSFDVVTCLGSLEHFPDMDRGLAEMTRVARADALFRIAVPNSEFLLWRLFGLGTEQQDLIERPMPLESWRELFERNGLHILRCEKEHWYLKRARVLTASAAFRNLERVLLKALWLALPLRRTYQFQFLLRKA
jgi:SAM-dependent methyltransferase